MSVPKKHHYVPEFYLRGFIDPSRARDKQGGILWVYERNKPIRQSTPRNEGYQRDFYTCEQEGEKKYEVEGYLSRIETAAASLLRRIQGRKYYFSESEKVEMASFVALAFSRVPSARSYTDSLLTEAIEKVRDECSDHPLLVKESELLSTKVGKAVTPDELRSVKRQCADDFERDSDILGLNEMFRISERIAQFMLEKKWQLWEGNHGGQAFLTSDSPVVTSSNEGSVGVGFGRPNVDIFYPLTSTIGLFMSHDQNAQEGRYRIPPAIIREFNKRILVCANRFVYATEKSEPLRTLLNQIGGKVIYGKNAFVGAPESS